MATPAKFMFDADFSSGTRQRAAMTPAEIAAKIAEAEAVAYQRGIAAGRAQAQAEAEQLRAAALAQIAAGLDTVRRGFAEIQNTVEREAVDVATAVARKLAEALIAREPMAEVAALVEDCLRQLTRTPHLVVRVNDALYENAKAAIGDIAQRCGFEGRLIILGEPDIASGDCRIEWADGGITREAGATAAAIDELVRRFLDSRNAQDVRTA